MPNIHPTVRHYQRQGWSLAYKASIYNDRTIRPKRSSVIGHRRRFLWEIVHQVGRAFAWIRGR